MAYALVTGASKGIGKALAKELASKGYDLALISLPGESLASVALELQNSSNRKVVFLEVDLAQPDGPKKVWEWAVDLQLDVEALINNAGFGTLGKIEEAPVEFTQAMISVNVNAAALLCCYFLPQLKARGKGYILTLGSTAGLMPVPFKTPYSASKAYIHFFSRALSLEVEGTGVSVTCLCPGGVRTRQEVISRIEKAGLLSRLSAMEPHQVAKIGVAGLLAKKRFVIPGLINQIFTRIARILPYTWYSRRLGRQVIKN